MSRKIKQVFEYALVVIIWNRNAFLGPCQQARQKRLIGAGEVKTDFAHQGMTPFKGLWINFAWPPVKFNLKFLAGMPLQGRTKEALI